MIKPLQRKTISTSMKAITILLVALLTIFNGANIYFSIRETNRLLDSLFVDVIQGKKRPPESRNFLGEIFSSAPSKNHRLSSIYFTVKLNASGEAVSVNIDRLGAESEKDAAKKVLVYAQKAYEEKKLEGFYDFYKFKGIVQPETGTSFYLFLDISSQIFSSIRILFLSFFTVVVCWLLMFVLVYFLSKKAIRPLEENLEKQKQFVTDAGHEIKTPLAIILSNTEAMELYLGENKWSKNIRNQITRLSGLMENLLTLSKIGEMSVSITRERTNISELLTQITTMFRESMELKKIDFDLKVQRDIFCHVNHDLFSRLCSILLDNAVKYTSEGGKITVCGEQKDKGVVLVFFNTCESLPAYPPEKLFDRFFRGDKARTQKEGGYGIGLSAAQSIVEAHGGKIAAAYKEQAIEFTITLP